jgi:hypothetical protein
MIIYQIIPAIRSEKFNIRHVYGDRMWTIQVITYNSFIHPDIQSFVYTIKRE